MDAARLGAGFDGVTGTGLMTAATISRSSLQERSSDARYGSRQAAE
jgi:hypothetical protein